MNTPTLQLCAPNEHPWAWEWVNHGELDWEHPTPPTDYFWARFCNMCGLVQITDLTNPNPPPKACETAETVTEWVDLDIITPPEPPEPERVEQGTLL